MSEATILWLICAAIGLYLIGYSRGSIKAIDDTEDDMDKLERSVRRLLKACVNKYGMGAEEYCRWSEIFFGDGEEEDHGED